MMDVSQLVILILGWSHVSLAEMYEAGEKLFKMIDKHKTYSIDVHMLKRELMKLNVLHL